MSKAVEAGDLFIARLSKERLTNMREFMATGKAAPVIEKRFGLREVADEAIR